MPAGDLLQTNDIESLYSGHHGWLQGWLRRKLGCNEQAADLAQDTFMRLFGRKGLELDQPRALLTHIAKGLIIDHWRRQEVERAYLGALANMPEALAPSAETHYLILESLYRIEAMLRGLPEKTREIFLRSQLDGMTYAQIAEDMGMSLITVKRHMKTGFVACMVALA